MLYDKEAREIKTHHLTTKASDAVEVIQKTMHVSTKLYDILSRIVDAWDSVDGDQEVPDEINKSDMWDEAREALKSARDQ